MASSASQVIPPCAELDEASNGLSGSLAANSALLKAFRNGRLYYNACS